MPYNMIICKGETGSFVTQQEYQGKIPPEANNVEIEGSSYHLTVFFFEEKKYLIAHEDHDLVVDAIEDAIKALNLSPM